MQILIKILSRIVQESLANVKEGATAAHVWKPTANQSKFTDRTNRHLTRWW